MSGRNSGHGGCINAHGGHRHGCSGGGGRGQHYTGTSATAKRGLCIALGTSVFDYGQKASADHMRTSWEKLVHYIGTNYGQDISNELQNKQTIMIVEPVHSNATLARHAN